MKRKTILIISLSVIAGLTLGYLIFGGDKSANDKTETAEGASAEEVIWTCSMHPQIRQNEPGQCPLCGMDLIPLEGSTSSDPLVFEMSEEAVKLSNIQTTVIGGADQKHTKEIRVTGKIQANETAAASLVAHIPGRIERLYVSFTGEKVSVGQKIAQIYSPNLITAQKELLEAKKIAETNPGLFNAAKNKLRYWKISDAQIEQILSSEKIQEHFMIYADYSGIVKNRKVSVGDYISQGEVLFDIQNLNKLWVLFDVYETNLSDVLVGSEVTFQTPSLPSKEFKATISFVDPVINSATRVATVRAELNNSARNLKPEMFVNGIIKSTTQKNTVVSVPKTAVLWTGERSVVYVKVPNTELPSFEFREVTLGESLGKNYIITDGLSDGEEVVTNGAFVIDASAQLNNQSSMMNRNVMSKGEQMAEQLPDYTSVTPKEFKQQLKTAVTKYIELKDNLVKSDPKMAEASARQFKSDLQKINMSLLKGDAHNYWMEKSKALNAHIDLFISKKDLEEKRKQFDFLSEALIQTVKVFGLPDGKYYEQYCPMAIEDKGASWLSLDSNIRNPYFGDKMLKCGEVKETITSDFKNKPVENMNMNKRPPQGHSH